MKRISIGIACIFITSQLSRSQVFAQTLLEDSGSNGVDQDYAGIANFIADFMQGLRIYSLCVSSTKGSEVVSRGVLASLSSYIIFTSPCCISSQNGNNTKICSAYDKYQTNAQYLSATGKSPNGKVQSLHKASNKSLPNLAEIQMMGNSDIVEAVDHVLKRYELTRGAITQAIIGTDLEVQRITANITARWIIASYHKVNQTATIYELNCFKYSGECLWQPLGGWNISSGISLIHDPGSALWNFQGHTLRLAAFPYPPYVMIGKTCEKLDHQWGYDNTYQYDPTCTTGPPKHSLTDELYVGYLIDLMEILAEKLNFTYKLVSPPDQDFTFGVGEESYNKGGLVGMIARKEADIILASLTYSNGRLRVLDFSNNIDFFDRNLYIRTDAMRLGVGWGTYILSFDKWTWLSIVAILVFTSFVFWVLIRKERNPPSTMVFFPDVLFMFFTCTMQQGTSNEPESYRSRAVFWIYWFTAIILHTSYTAVLTSYLTVSTDTFPFSTLAEAVASYPDWKIGIITGTPLQQLIQESQGTEYRILSQRLDDDPSLLVNSEAVGLNRIMTENYVFFADSPALTYELRDNCSISEIQSKLFFSYGHLGYAKNLPFITVLDSELLRMNMAGVMNRLYQRWWRKKKPCKEPEAFTELGFPQTITAFLLLLTGVVLSLVFLVSEVFYSYRRRKREVEGKDDKEMKEKPEGKYEKRITHSAKTSA